LPISGDVGELARATDIQVVVLHGDVDNSRDAVPVRWR